MELNIERIAMIAALIVMGGAVIVKIVTMQLMKAMQRSIEVVNQSRIKAVRELSKAQSRKNITASEQHKLVSKRKKIRKKIRTLKSELLSFKKAESERQKASTERLQELDAEVEAEMMEWLGRHRLSRHARNIATVVGL